MEDSTAPVLCKEVVRKNVCVGPNTEQMAGTLAGAAVSGILISKIELLVIRNYQPSPRPTRLLPQRMWII